MAAQRIPEVSSTPDQPRGCVRAALFRGAFATAALVALALAGCQLLEPRTTSQPAVPREGNAALIAYISDQPLVTAEAAYRATYLLAKGASFAGDFEALADALRSDGLISKGWQYAADQFVDKAAIGFMICRACKIQTGVNWNLTGLGRYAWRELLFHRIAEGGSEYGLMSGGEFVGLLLRADDYLRRTGKGQAEGVELGPRAK